MKHHLLTLTLAWLFLGAPLAQQIDLKGQISIHNSGYNTGTIEYVSNAFISAPFAGSTSSDVEGKFNLTFNEILEGTSIKLSVEKAGYEIVNQKDLLDVVLGRRLPVKIYLATRGQLALAQTQLYKVSLKAITKRYDETIAQLRQAGAESQAVITDLEQRLNRTISDRFEAEQLLTEQLEATKSRLPEFARELATVNLDFATEMYREAYAYFEAGEIEKAIETLDEAILDKAAAEVVANLDSISRYINQLEEAIDLGDEQLIQLIASARLKAQAYAERAQYEQAIAIHEEVIQLLETRELMDTALAEVYWQTGQWYQRLDEPVPALIYSEKSLKQSDSLQVIPDTLLGNRYVAVAEMYESESNIDAAILYYQKAYDLPLDKAVFPLEETLIQLLEQRAWELAEAGSYGAAIQRYEALKQLPIDSKYERKVRRQIKKWQKQQ